MNVPFLGTIFDLAARHASPALLKRFYQGTPMRLLEDVVYDRFRRTVRWAASRSEFYREAFRQRGIDPRRVRRPEDLGDLFTTPTDLADNPTAFICQRPQLVFESSGTSGRNKRVYFGRAEWEHMGRTVAAGFRIMGIEPEDRVANAFDFSIWIPGMLCHYGVMANGNFTQAFGKVDPGEVYRRLKQENFNVILGEPTWLIRLTELAEKHGAVPLKLIIGGAEEMPAAAIPWIQTVWKGAKLKMCYASVEMALAIGFQPCANQDGYHLDTVDFLPEIVEPDEDGWGELVFTTLSRRTMPLIRYRTRDVTRMTPGGCPCGAITPHISRLRGRRDELVVASGGNLYPLMFERILESVPGISHDWQVVFKLEGVREVLELNIETTRSDFGDLDREIYAQATALYPDLMKNLAINIFSMKIVHHTLGSIRPSRKLKRLLDLRHNQTAAGNLHGASEPIRMNA